MIFFVTVLRALAACLITNAHYTGVYPTDLIANGGLIGDVLFFAVSGYCLYNIKTGFLKWYSKRLVRCYLPVLLVTALYMLLGFYTLNENGFVWWYVYPTYYHFVASIVVLYIPYFLIIKFDFLRNRLLHIMIAVGIVAVVTYAFFYDKTYYHIDTVREPFIRFLFFESMLLGAWFKQKDQKHRGEFSWKHIVACFFAFIVYFASKLVFSKVESISVLQIVNQALIFILLFFIFRLFSGLDDILNRMPRFMKKGIEYISEITLEIYVVQYVLIDIIRPVFRFPLNWLALTFSIIVSATALHYICKPILQLFERMMSLKKSDNAIKGEK